MRFRGVEDETTAAVEERFVQARALTTVQVVQTVDRALDVIERVD